MIRQAAAPNVTVRARGKHARSWLELSSPSQPKKPLQLEIVDPVVLRKWHTRFLNDVERVRQQWGGAAPLNPSVAGEALKNLASAGQGLLARILPRAQEQYQVLGERLREWCPSWYRGVPFVPVLHIEPGLAGCVPWELLPLFDLTWQGAVRDATELRDAARIFPAFSAVVERFLFAGNDHDPYLTATTGSLPLRFLWNAAYPGARSELGVFRASSAIRLEGPYPLEQDDELPANIFADQIADPGLDLNGKRLIHPNQVLHISCHCVATAASSAGGDEAFELHLAGENTAPIVIPIDAIVTHLIPAWARAQKNEVASKPMVFLNACGTAVYDPWSLQSILEPFERNRNRGVIATAANLPDRLANRFSRHFYSSLLVGGTTVGEALHIAKWRLLEDQCNPVGMLYSLHGSSRLQVIPVPQPRAAA